jgi:molybdopterin-guanine dinucleotide biosynthesis protein
MAESALGRAGAVERLAVIVGGAGDGDLSALATTLLASSERWLVRRVDAPLSRLTVKQTFDAIPASLTAALVVLAAPVIDVAGEPALVVGDDPAAYLPGRFRLDRLLASGAFGTVYRARQLAVDRDVAVKVLHADIDPDSEDGRLFIHEIQAVGRIDHVNVVRIYQADVAPSGRLFFAMELLHGDDLQQVIDRDGPLPRTRALALIAQLLAGLGAAHDLGLVHADVKPGNLVVVGERLVLVDFGLARLRPPNQAAESMGGTPAYMAPEQLRDGRVDARSDLFAVGLVVVSLLTGWQRVDLGELVPPLDTLIVDPELRAVLARALALDPAQRYQSAAELARALAGGDVAITAPARSPFRHLAPFTEADRDHLHGRDRDVAALVEQLAIRRVLVYTAPSGTGKTSLLRAGLVPRLTALGLRALYVTASADGAAATVRSRLDARPEVSVQAAIETWHRGGGARVAVIVDQVEAVLDGAHDDSAAALVRELLGLERADADAVVVLSVREDFLGRLLAFDPRLQAGVPVVRLPPLARDGAQAAIVLALAAHHIAIEPALLARCSTISRPPAPPSAPSWAGADPRGVSPAPPARVLGALRRARAGATTLTLAHYQRLGGFDAIVGEYLERVLDSELDADAARIARELFVGAGLGGPHPHRAHRGRAARAGRPRRRRDPRGARRADRARPPGAHPRSRRRRRLGADPRQPGAAGRGLARSPRSVAAARDRAAAPSPAAVAAGSGRACSPPTSCASSTLTPARWLNSRPSIDVATAAASAPPPWWRSRARSTGAPCWPRSRWRPPSPRSSATPATTATGPASPPPASARSAIATWAASRSSCGRSTGSRPA